MITVKDYEQAIADISEGIQYPIEGYGFVHQSYFNRGTAYLLNGQFREAWSDYFAAFTWSFREQSEDE